MLAVPFVSVSDYLFLLREAAQALAPAGASALLYLAAAVSDFYLPESAMAEHKIQSGGGLALELSGVPKVLGAVKAEWAPAALVVSFKLETNEHVLLAKAAGALRKYAVDLVVANRLATYKRHVTLVMRSNPDTPPSAPAVRGDETRPCRRGRELRRDRAARRPGRHRGAAGRASRRAARRACLANSWKNQKDAAAPVTNDRYASWYRARDTPNRKCENVCSRSCSRPPRCRPAT